MVSPPTNSRDGDRYVLMMVVENTAQMLDVANAYVAVATIERI